MQLRSMRGAPNSITWAGQDSLRDFSVSLQITFSYIEFCRRGATLPPNLGSVQANLRQTCTQKVVHAA